MFKLSKTTIVITSSVLVMGLFASVVEAQSMIGATSPAKTQADAEDQSASLAPISVIATRNPIQAFDFPGMVTVIDRDQIQAQQPSSPGDILKWVPNVEFIGGPRRDAGRPSIRGFEGPNVITLIDDARQNFDTRCNASFFLDPSLVRKVEVLRGPASSLYGSGGMGGVIGFRTVRAEDFLKADEISGVTVSSGYQSAIHETSWIVTTYGRMDPNLDLLGSITKRVSGTINFGDGSKLTSNDDDIISGLVKGNLKFSKFHEIEASILHFSNDPVEPRIPRGTGSKHLAKKDINTDTFRLAYSYAKPGDNLLDLNALVYKTQFRIHDQVITGPSQGIPFRRDVDTIGFRLDNRSRISLSKDVGIIFTYGFDAYHDEQDASAGASGTRDGVPDAESTFAGIFGQAEIHLMEPFGAPGSLSVVPGLRYDHYQASSEGFPDNKDDKLSTRIGLSYFPTDWALVFANYAEAFRAPTFDELYPTGVHFRMPIGNNGVITNRFQPNPDLKPQTTETVELGAGLDFTDLAVTGDRFQVKASYFRTDAKDFIDRIMDQPFPPHCNPAHGGCDGISTSINVPDARLWGNELEASYDHPRFRINLGFSNVNGENKKTGEKLGVLTPAQLSITTALKLPEYHSMLGWRIFHANDFNKVDDSSYKVDGYTINDFFFNWSPAQKTLKGLRLDLGVDNIFDRYYQDVYTRAPLPGRNFKVQISYSRNW